MKLEITRNAHIHWVLSCSFPRSKSLFPPRSVPARSKRLLPRRKQSEESASDLKPADPDVHNKQRQCRRNFSSCAFRYPAPVLLIRPIHRNIGLQGGGSTRRSPLPNRVRRTRFFGLSVFRLQAPPFSQLSDPLPGKNEVLSAWKPPKPYQPPSGQNAPHPLCRIEAAWLTSPSRLTNLPDSSCRQPLSRRMLAIKRSSSGLVAGHLAPFCPESPPKSTALLPRAIETASGPSPMLQGRIF